MCLFLKAACFGLQYVIVAFPGHTPLLLCPLQIKNKYDQEITLLKVSSFKAVGINVEARATVLFHYA